MRQWINLFENQQPHMIEVSDDQYSMEGYVTDTGSEQIDNWLSYRHHINDKNLVEMIRTRFKKIAFLNNINVEEDARGEGHGNYLMESFIEEATDHNAEAIILLADIAEDQQEGFDLVKWYEGWGFKIIHQSSGGPLMMMVF